MSNASLKDQLQAMASQLVEKKVVETQHKQKPPRQQPRAQSTNKPSHPTKSVKPQDRSAPPKPKWLIYMQYGVELLRAYFPQCFKEGSEIKPLKKGIKQDLIKRLSTLEQIVTEDKACMVKSLAYYVNTGTYHKSVIEGAMRIDLDGLSAGIVLAEEANYSKERSHAKLQMKQGATKSEQSQPTEPHAELTQ